MFLTILNNELMLTSKEDARVSNKSLDSKSSNAKKIKTAFSQINVENKNFSN